MAESETTSRGYQFFEQDTGVARFLRPRYIPFLKAWDVTPTKDDVSGIDMSSTPMSTVKFDVSNTEENLRNTVIQYGYNALGINLAPYVNALPDNYLREHLFNVVYNRPILIDAVRLRMGDTLTTNPYAAAGYFLTMYLLRAMANLLTSTPSNAFKKQGAQLNGLADHLRFALDRILVNHNLTDLPTDVIIDVLEITQTDNNGTKLTSNQTLYIARDYFDAWVAKGGDEPLLVAQWGLYGKNVDDDTIANKATIMAAWEASQTPPSN